MRSHRDPRREWVRALPRSKMKFPSRLDDRAKYVFWSAIRPYHNFFRDSLLQLRLISPPYRGRQDYLIGHLAPGKSIRQFVQHLILRGFGNHFIAWKDEGEVVGLRLVQDFRHQYHVRIFEDGEVRAHYEYTPEYRPIKHVKMIGQEPRFADIAAHLEGWIIPVSQELARDSAEEAR